MPAKALTVTEFLLARIAEDEADVEWLRSLPAKAHTRRRLARECVAKRHIVLAAEFSGPREFEDTMQGICRALAAVYSDHHDYREEWDA